MPNLTAIKMLEADRGKRPSSNLFPQASARCGTDSNLPPEGRLLLHCAGARTAQDEYVAQAFAADPTFDWPTFVELAVQHNLVPQVYAWLGANSGFADDLREEMGRRFKSITFRNFGLAGALIKLQRAFIGAGIRVVWFKGPVLAQQVHGSLAMRESLDLDVLVPYERIDEVNRILLQQNYAPRFNLVEPRQQRLHERISGQHAFHNPKRVVCLDLHWALTENNYTFSNQCPVDTCEIVVAGHRISTFSAETNVCYLCYHGCKHNWRSIRWVSDIAALIRGNRDLDFERLVTTPQLPIGTSRMLKLGLYMAHFDLAAPLPERVIDWIRDDASVAELAQRVRQCWFGPTNQSDPRVYEATMESLTDRIRYRVGKVLNPTALELEQLNLPGSFFFLYVGLRCIRLVRKRFVPIF